MKKRPAVVVAVFILASLMCVELAHGGAWTVPKYRVWSEYYMKWDYAKDTYNESSNFASSGDHVKNFRTWEFVQEPKIEYGITDYLNFLYSMEFKEAHYKEYNLRSSLKDTSFTRKNHGLTNVKIGGKWRFLEKPVVQSLQGKFFIYPGYGIYRSEKRRGGKDGYPYQPSIGYGDNAFELRWLMGQSFKFPIRQNFQLPVYWGTEGGYRWRSAAVCNDIPYFFECGFWPVPWFLVKTEIDGYRSHDTTGSIKESYGIWRIGGVWQVFGDSALREGDKMFNLEFQYGMTVWGRNTNRAQEWILKVQTQF